MTEEEKKSKRWGWYTKQEMALMSPEEREKVYVPYQPSTEKIQSQLNELSDNQGQILHELSEIRADIMWLLKEGGSHRS